jgi:hypothetical protein
VRAEQSETARQGFLQTLLYRSPFLPPVTRLVVGNDGKIWLRGTDDWSGTVEWLVLDTAGNPDRVVQTERRIEILAAQGDTVWAATMGAGQLVSVAAIRSDLCRGAEGLVGSAAYAFDSLSLSLFT